MTREGTGEPQAAVELGGTPVLVAREASGSVGRARLRDLVMEAHDQSATMLALDAAALEPAFFDLRSGVAGDLLQATVVYAMPLAIVGPLPAPATASRAFTALVRESNRGRDHWFVADLDELAGRLATRTPARG